MKISHKVDNTLPKDARQFVEHLANTRLNRFAAKLRDVHATVTDINGPKGGVDIRCRLRLTFKRGNEIVIQETAASIREALSNAFERAARSVARQTDRIHRGRIAAGRQSALAAQLLLET